MSEPKIGVDLNIIENKNINKIRDEAAKDHEWSIDCTCDDPESGCCWFHLSDREKASSSFKAGFDHAVNIYSDLFDEIESTISNACIYLSASGVKLMDESEPDFQMYKSLLDQYKKIKEFRK